MVNRTFIILGSLLDTLSCLSLRTGQSGRRQSATLELKERFCLGDCGLQLRCATVDHDYIYIYIYKDELVCSVPLPRLATHPNPTSQPTSGLRLGALRRPSRREEHPGRQSHGLAHGAGGPPLPRETEGDLLRGALKTGYGGGGECMIFPLTRGGGLHDLPSLPGEGGGGRAGGWKGRWRLETWALWGDVWSGCTWALFMLCAVCSLGRVVKASRNPSALFAKGRRSHRLIGGSLDAACGCGKPFLRNRVRGNLRDLFALDKPTHVDRSTAGCEEREGIPKYGRGKLSIAALLLDVSPVAFAPFYISRKRTSTSAARQQMGG